MPKLSNHHAQQIVKALVIGDSGAGKTGALASLADAGYNLRILDLDNGLDVLFSLLTNPASPYKRGGAERVHYLTMTETMKNLAGKVVPAKASVWGKVMKALDGWKEPESEGSPAIDLGKVSEWGPNDVLVIDSLTALSTAAFNFHRSMQGRLHAEQSGNEWRRDIGSSQSLVEDFLKLLYDDSIKCNVVVISHVVYSLDESSGPSLGDTKTMIGYPSSLGKALAPKIPRYFNSMLVVQTQGTGQGTRHMIYTHSQGIVGGKTSAPLSVKKSYPVQTGLADYFADVTGRKPEVPSA